MVHLFTFPHCIYFTCTSHFQFVYEMPNFEGSQHYKTIVCDNPFQSIRSPSSFESPSSFQASFHSLPPGCHPPGRLPGRILFIPRVARVSKIKFKLVLFSYVFHFGGRILVRDVFHWIRVVKTPILQVFLRV